MCSISGFYDPTADFTGQRDSFLHILDEMKHCLAHRGPDDNDSLLTPHCGLAHTRLSIIDLAGGHQPMTRELDGYPYHIVYNGEIYNTLAVLTYHGIGIDGWTTVLKDNKRLDELDKNLIILMAKISKEQEDIIKNKGISHHYKICDKNGKTMDYCKIKDIGIIKEIHSA